MRSEAAELPIRRCAGWVCRPRATVGDQNIDAGSAFDVDQIGPAAIVSGQDQDGAPVADVRLDLRELAGTEDDAIASKKLSVKVPFGVGDVGPNVIVGRTLVRSSVS